MWDKLVLFELINCDSITSIGIVNKHYYKYKSKGIRKKHSIMRSY